MYAKRAAGFTLLELMITLAVLAIVTAIAFPNFQGVIRSNRVATTSNEMIASLSLARSEAIRGTRGGGICASTAGAACDGASWDSGWIIWTDTNGNGTFDSGVDTVVRYIQGHPKLSVANAVNTTVRFDSRGRAVGGAQGFVITPNDDTYPSKSVCVTATGQIRGSNSSC